MDLFDAYMLGWKLQYLKRAPFMDAYVKGEHYIIDNLKQLLNNLEEYNISSLTQYEIRELIKKYEEKYDEKEQLDDEDKNELVERLKLWHDRITNELLEREMIEVFTEGTLNFKKLLYGGKTFFSDEVWDLLSDVSKSDLNDACNCLLTRSWTPAVMISLRASEDSIRKLYEFKTGNAHRRKGWKNILDELGNIEGINQTLIGYLNYIREIRNTAEHPDEVFDQMEAERLFHQVVNMITVIYQELTPKRPLDELNVKELRALLKCRNLKTSGKKAELVQRFEECAPSSD